MADRSIACPAFVMVHIIRFQEYADGVYRADIRSKVDVIRHPQTSVKVEFKVKEYNFHPCEAYVHLHKDAPKYHLIAIRLCIAIAAMIATIIYVCIHIVCIVCVCTCMWYFRYI